MDTLEEKRALVVGYGHMGRIHARALSDLGYRVTTCDPSPGAGADWRRVEHIGFHAVCIATTIEHCAEAAADWEGFEGHLLIEKPAAMDRHECEALREILAGQRVAVGYVERFNPVVRGLTIDSLPVSWATFWRFNDRPTPDPWLDLRSHDIDLARFLGLDLERCLFMAGQDGRKRRDLLIEAPGVQLRADLMAHKESPVHAQWASFLEDGDRHARMGDALAVHEYVEANRMVAVAA